MSRMCDRLIREGYCEHEKGDLGQYKGLYYNTDAAARYFEQGVEVLTVDNVARYVFDADNLEGVKEWNMLTDFPNLAPPFQAFWMEYSIPSGKTPGSLSAIAKHAGIWFCVTNPERDKYEAWKMVARLFLDFDRHAPIACVLQADWSVEPDGRVLQLPLLRSTLDEGFVRWGRVCFVLLFWLSPFYTARMSLYALDRLFRPRLPAPTNADTINL